MTLPDTPDLGRRRCPLCEPESTIDPRTDFRYTEYCAMHSENRDVGADDPPGPGYSAAAGTEADGFDCRRVAAVLRRWRRRRP